MPFNVIRLGPSMLAISIILGNSELTERYGAASIDITIVTLAESYHIVGPNREGEKYNCPSYKA